MHHLRQALFNVSCLATTFATICALSGPLRAESPDEVEIGPVVYQQNVNGVAVSLSATTYIRVATSDKKIKLNARVVGDLSDLQRKIGPIVDSFNLPKDNCRSFSPNNPVVSIPRKELSFANGAALFSVGGSVTMWECLENPVPNSKIEWEIRDVGFGIKTKVPVLKTWPGSPIKTILVTQPFNASLPVSLVTRNAHSVAVEFSKPDIELAGQYAFITKGILKIAGIDINQKAQDALQKAIDPEKLLLTIPDDLSKYGPTVTSSRFLDAAGHLSAEIELAAEIPAAAINDLLKTLLERTKS